MNIVWIYVDTSKDVGDVDQVFASADAADKWFEENDPESVAFGYEVMECAQCFTLKQLRRQYSRYLQQIDR